MKSYAKSAAPLTWSSAPDILTVEEAALLARVPRNGMYQAVRLGLIPSVNFGQRRTRIAKAALAKVFALRVESIPSLMPSNDLEA